jgi:ATP-binding cassette subfamily F protein uup
MSVLLSVQGLTKGFGPRPLFRELCLDLRAGQRMGLVGPNGSGKSTLLKVLAGSEMPDAGVRTLRRGVRLGYLPQEERFATGQTVGEVLLAALVDEPLEEHERLTRAAMTWTQAGFSDPGQAAANLSGGWCKRLALARALVRQPQLLLLDEPTNHLDLPSIVWLQRLLRAAPFGYVVATHDRAFLRAVADEIVELNRIYPGGALRVVGSYDTFRERREEFQEAQARQQQAVANQVRRETEWLARKAAARTRKSSARIDAASERRDDLEELKYRNAPAAAAGLDFVATGRQTRKLLDAGGIGKSLAGRLLFAGLDIRLRPGTKLALLGPNGSGKSTLVRVLAGTLPPEAGTVVRADGLQVAMLEQGRTTLKPAVTLRRALSPNGDTLVVRGRPMHVAAWAKQFLFTPEQLDQLVGDLSGGEQARVRIAQLMVQPADLLFLDEPTNDLDIPALEVLEDSLAAFPGALVLVSHDRELLDRLGAEVIGLDGLGGAAPFGSVEQWLTALEKTLFAPQPAATASRRGEVTARTASAPVKPRKLNYRDQQEWEQMESSILAAEAAVVKWQQQVEQAATREQVALREACRGLEGAQRTVESLYARWQQLEVKRSGGA